MMTDIRWIQRLSNYQKALQQLGKFIEKNELNELEQQGLIQAFEYTHELAWNVLRDYLIDKGHQNIHGSRDATREAYSLELISQGDSWMAMIMDRNRTSLTYNQDTAISIANNITQNYYPLFIEMQQKMTGFINDDD